METEAAGPATKLLAVETVLAAASLVTETLPEAVSLAVDPAPETALVTEETTLPRPKPAAPTIPAEATRAPKAIRIARILI